MTTVLNEFVENTKILPTPMNENFSGLQQDIADVNTTLSGNITTLSTTVTSLSNTVTSQGSTITTQGTSISNLQSTVSGLGGTYSDLSLSNTNSTGKRNVENWNSPNVNSRWGISSGYVTTQPGYISVILDGTSDDVDGWVNINGVAVYHKHEGGDWSSGHDSCFFAVQQGVTVTYGSSNCNFYVTFWACVGG